MRKMHDSCLIWKERLPSCYTREKFKVIARKMIFKLKTYFAKNDILVAIVTQTSAYFWNIHFFFLSIGNLMHVKISLDYEVLFNAMGVQEFYWRQLLQAPVHHTFKVLAVRRNGSYAIRRCKRLSTCSIVAIW